jgi:hypothetical protein
MGSSFFNQNPPKKLTKTHTKPTRKIKYKNKYYKKKNSIFFANPYLIDTPISNNTHQKNCQKNHKNPQEKTHTLF